MFARRWIGRGLAATLAIYGCGGDAIGPPKGQPPEDPPPTFAPTISVAAAPAQAEPDSTIEVVFLVKRDAEPSSGDTVSFAVEAGGGALVTPLAVSDDAGRATARWTLGRAGEAQRLKGTVGTASAVASVRGVPIIAQILAAVAPSDVGAIGDTVRVDVTALDRYGVQVPLPSPSALSLDGELRALTQLPVLEPVSATRLVARGPGDVDVLATWNGLVSDPMHVTVTSAVPIVAQVDAGAGRLQQGDPVTLRGYRLDLIGAGAVRVDGAPVEPTSVAADQWSFVAPAHTVDPAECAGQAAANIEVADAIALGPLPLAYERAGETTLAVGDAMRLGAIHLGCVRVAPDPDAEYVLLYFDTRGVTGAETGPESQSLATQVIDISIEDRSSGAPAAVRTVEPQALTTAPFDAPPKLATTSSAATSIPEDWIGFRTTPLAIGDRVSFFLFPDYQPGTVVRVYGGKFPLVVLDADSAAHIPDRLSVLDDEMQIVLEHAVPTMERALSPNFPEFARGVGQFPLVLTTMVDGPAAYYSDEAIVIDDAYPVGQPAFVNWFIVAHELAHAWQFQHADELCAGSNACSGPAGTAWSLEGGADFLTEETGRRRTGNALDANVEANAYAHYLGIVISSGGAFLFGKGYGSSAWFLRDLLVRAVAAGVPEDVAVRAVAQGAAEGWYGQGVGAGTAPGLVGRMSAALGVDWDPVDALLTSGVSLGMDELTSSPAHSFAAYHNAWETYPPMVMIGPNDEAGLALHTFGISFGYARIHDAGRGGSYLFDGSVDGIEWILGRVR